MKTYQKLCESIDIQKQASDLIKQIISIAYNQNITISTKNQKLPHIFIKLSEKRKFF